jgi:hypothetical protein
MGMQDGEPDDVNWSDDFRSHWSEHAVQALWALNAWHQQESDRWNRPPA